MSFALGAVLFRLAAVLLRLNDQFFWNLATLKLCQRFFMDGEILFIEPDRTAMLLQVFGVCS